MPTHHFRIVALISALFFCLGVCTTALAQITPRGPAAAQSNEHDCVKDITVGVNVSARVIPARRGTTR